MAKANGSKSFFKTYGFLIFMLTGIVAGCLVGAFAPNFGKKIEFLGTLFINMMFCVVVPMVFCSIASAIANMKSVKRAGKIMGVTIATFLVTAAIAGVIMYIVCRIFPLVDGHYTITEGEIGDTLGFGDMIVNFFTKPDFMELLSRKAILPLIVAAVLFGFGIQMNGGPETKTAQVLEDITGCIMKTVKLITYYAPIGFFGFFANLVSTYGPELVADYSRTLIIYYVMSFVYMFVFFPIYAQFGGGKGGAKIMFSKLFRPAAVSFGTCSSVATIPTNMEVADETGISKDVTDIVLPMGATMHMDGSAMSAIIKVAFLFGVFGLDFTTEKAILAIIVAVFSSVAMSGIPRRRRYRRAGSLHDLLPRPAGCCLPDRTGDRQPRRSSGDHGQLRRRLCCVLHRLPLCGRQGLAAEGHCQEERKQGYRAVICRCIKFLPPGNTTVYRMGGIFYAWKSRDLRCQHGRPESPEQRRLPGTAHPRKARRH